MLSRVNYNILVAPAICLLLIVAALPGFSQDTGKPVTLKIENKSLKHIINKISRESGIRFSYSHQQVDLSVKLNVNFDQVPVSEALNELLDDYGISWITVQGQIILKKKKDTVSHISDREEGNTFIISGFLRDITTGDALIGANVYLEGTQTGVATNNYGFYSLRLPGGKQNIVFSYLGYASDTVEVKLLSNLELNNSLREAILGINEVIITGSRSEAISGLDRLSDFSFTGKELSKLPGFAGDVDLVKALQTLPGIRSFGDGSSLFFVRGGNHDQNLLMIDGVPIYNPSHLFGFFSVITPDAVNDMKVFKGDFPAQYGGRASSVIDVTTREGNMNRFGFGGNIGPYASSLSVDGPIIKDKLSFNISGRLSTLNWLNDLMDNETSFRIYFYDLNAKVKLISGAKDQIFFTFYTGKDEFRRIINSVYRSFGISWENYAASLRWNHIFNPRVFAVTNVNTGNYRYFLHLAPEKSTYWKSSIMNLTVKEDVSWYVNSRNTFRAGLGFSRYISDPGNIYFEDPEDGSSVLTVSKYYSNDFSFYAGNEQDLTPKLHLYYGLRLSWWQNIGPGRVYYFDANHQVIDTINVSKNRYYSSFAEPEPRISATFDVFSWLKIKAAYSRTVQYMQLLSNGSGPFTSLDVWTPAGPNIPPLKTDQTMAGILFDVVPGKLRVSVEGFYKHFYDHLDYADHANLLYNPLLEGELRIGEAWSKGIELLLEKTGGKFSGWLGYTYSRAMVKTPEVNQGEIYPASYDSPHNISLFISYDTYRRWAFSANWIYMTGNPWTEPIGFYQYDGYSVPVYGQKNNARLPDYHRLDLAVTCRLNKPESRYRHQVVFTLYNAYGRANPYTVSYNKYRNSDGRYLVPADLDGNYELVPTMISVAGVIPSINYQFKF